MNLYEQYPFNEQPVDIPNISTRQEEVDNIISRLSKKQSSPKASQLKLQTNKHAKQIPTKKLSGGGKIALAFVFAGAVAQMISDRHPADQPNQQQRPKKHRNYSLQRITTNNYYETQDNIYTQQIATNISSYRYGKRIGGFM